MHFSCSFKRILKCITLPAIINSLTECYTMQLYDKIKFPYKLLTYSHAQHSNSIMHHYECVALCKDIGLQRGRFCTRSVASCVPKIQQRQVIMNALHPSRDSECPGFFVGTIGHCINPLCIRLVNCPAFRSIKHYRECENPVLMEFSLVCYP